jgi:hypothetical protein
MVRHCDAANYSTSQLRRLRIYFTQPAPNMQPSDLNSSRRAAKLGGKGARIAPSVQKEGERVDKKLRCVSAKFSAYVSQKDFSLLRGDNLL